MNWSGFLFPGIASHGHFLLRAPFREKERQRVGGEKQKQRQEEGSSTEIGKVPRETMVALPGTLSVRVVVVPLLTGLMGRPLTERSPDITEYLRT